MEKRAKILMGLSHLLDQRKSDLLAANNKDFAEHKGLDLSLAERLKVDEGKIQTMIRSLQESADKPDPDGKIRYEYRREDGLYMVNKSVPFGTILIIYESRPDVTIEATAMAFKSGNKILLKGGKEARHTNLLLTSFWHKVLSEHGYDKSWVKYLDISRQETQYLIADKDSGIDLIIPRGGDSLIDFVVKNAKAPVIVSGRGNNFMYIHKDADLEMATHIIINGKSRISVCNALDKVLLHTDFLQNKDTIAKLLKDLNSNKIEIMGDQTMDEFVELIEINTDEKQWYNEFLSPMIMLSIVSDMDEAMEKINTYSGGHSAVIVTRDQEQADLFMERVDCAAVYHNASTRFTDGSQVGFGGEMAISTQKLHFRGPIGIDQLVTNKWFIYGEGHIRN